MIICLVYFSGHFYYLWYIHWRNQCYFIWLWQDIEKSDIVLYIYILELVYTLPVCLRYISKSMQIKDLKGFAWLRYIYFLKFNRKPLFGRKPDLIESLFYYRNAQQEMNWILNLVNSKHFSRSMNILSKIFRSP